MALAFLLDERLRGPLWNAIQRHNAESDLVIDAAHVGDVAELPLGCDDPTILQWAEREVRIVLTEDKQTMPVHLQRHLKSGRHSPGVFILRIGNSTSKLLECIELVAHVGEGADYRDIVTFIP